MQPPGGGDPRARDLADNGSQSLLAQRFLDQRKDFPLAFGHGIDHPIRVEAGTQKDRGEQIATRQTSEHKSLEPSGNLRGEERCTAGLFGGKSRLDQLVQRASSKAAAGQMIVNSVQAERKRLGSTGNPFKPGDPEPQTESLPCCPACSMFRAKLVSC